MPLATVLTSFVLLTLAAPPEKSTGPRIRVPEGFQLQLVAGPPLVDRPICFDFDELGRLYVSEASGTNDPIAVQAKKLPHRVLRLVDTDGDGVFDKRTVFADQMMLPEGAMWHDGSLYVGAPPHIWKLTDTNDDGVADVREQWFKGQTLGGCANDMHGPYLGPDGWFYWCKGEFAQATYERPNKKPLVTKAAHVFRRRPEGGQVEIVLTGGMNNPVEVAFSRGGEPFLSSTFLENPQHGKRDGLAHIIYGGVYGKQFGVVEEHPRTGPLLPVLTQMGAAAPCGLARLETDALGPGFAENLLACQFNTHKVSRHVLVLVGATFTTKDEDFVVSSDVDFHPTDVMEDADGSVLMIDTGGWYKVCCPTSQLYKPDVLGGIYRISKIGAPRVADPRGMTIDWPKQSIEQLTALLADPRFAVRQRAVSLLVKQKGAAVPALAVVTMQSKNATARREAVWALTRIDDASARVAVRPALFDNDEQVRQAALHSVALWRDREAYERLVLDASGNLTITSYRSQPNRRATAEALGRIGDPQSVPLLLGVAGVCRDRAEEHSIIYALMEIGDAKQVRKGLTSEKPLTVRAAVIALDQMDEKTLTADDVAPLLNSPNQKVREAVWWVTERHPDWAPMIVNQSRGPLLDPQTSADDLLAFATRLSLFARHPAVVQFVAESLRNPATPLHAKVALLQVVAAGGQQQLPGVWVDPLLELLQSKEVRPVWRTVSALRGLTGAALDNRIVARLQQIAGNADWPEKLRLEALATAQAGGAAARKGQPLALSDEQFAFLHKYLSLEQPLTTRLQVAEILAASRLMAPQIDKLCDALHNTGPVELMLLLPLFKQSPDAALGKKLLATVDGHTALTSLDPTALKAALSGLHPSLAGEADKLVAKIAAANLDKLRQLDAMLERVKHGDVARGQQVFYSTKASCSACHMVGYLGGNVGPGLAGIGRARSERDLLEAVLFPSASFVRTFEPVIIDTKDGLTYTGVIRNETESELLLALDAEKVVRIPVANIEKRAESKVSIMPAGLDKQLTPEELADLIAFLKNAQ